MNEDIMTGKDLTVPAAPVPLEEQVARLTRWIEGWTEADGTPKAGLLHLVGELHAELIARRERREMLSRALASGSILAIFGYALSQLKDHWK